MSFSIDRNPSPPPELLDEDKSFVPDRVGTTVYSKRWLYKTLMNMLKVVQEYSPVESSLNETSTSETEETDHSNQPIIELDPKIEEDACTLWDMSANLEVAEFLCECNIADIFLAIIEHTKSPRLLEIVIGILGNVSSFNSTCEYISKNQDLINAIIMLSGCSDSCTLVQLFRLLTCGIVKENCHRDWFNAFEKNAFLMENLKSILENNLCRDVLCGLLEFLENVINYNPAYCSLWGEQSYSLAIIECGKQLLICNHNEDLDVFFTVINSLCQQSCNIPVYGKHFESLRPLFHTYISRLGEEEYLPQVARISAVISAFALYGNLLFSGSIPPENVLFEDSLFKAMLKICKMLKNILLNFAIYREENSSPKQSLSSTSPVTMGKERNGDALEEGDTIQNWQILLDAVIHAAKACIPFTNMENELQLLEEIINFQKFTDLVS